MTDPLHAPHFLPPPASQLATVELLVLVWGVFFISASRETEPTQKARNFAKSLQRASSMMNKKTSTTQREQPGTDDEQQPDWDAGGGDVYISSSSESGAKNGVRQK